LSPRLSGYAGGRQGILAVVSAVDVILNSFSRLISGTAVAKKEISGHSEK
jgi:hypothetical protein